MTPEDTLSKTDLIEINHYITEGVRVGGEIVDDDWIGDRFRRLWLSHQDVTHELADHREARKSWVADYDRLLEMEMKLQRMLRKKSPPALIIGELVKLGARRKQRVG